MFGKKNEDVVQHDTEYFTILDSKTGKYERPWPSNNTATCIRELTNLLKDPSQSQNRFVANPEDFSVYKVGTFSQATGQFLTHNGTHVVNLRDLAVANSYLQAPGPKLMD